MVKFFRSQWQDAIPFIAFWVLNAAEGKWSKILAGVLTVYWFGVILFRYCWKDHV